MKKFPERPVEWSDVIRERLPEVLVSWVLQGFADGLVVLEPEYIRNVPRIKEELYRDELESTRPKLQGNCAHVRW